jgi:hypothetical protein
VAINHGDETASVPMAEARVLVGTDRGRDGERVDATLTLDPWEAVVVETVG